MIIEIDIYVYFAFYRQAPTTKPTTTTAITTVTKRKIETSDTELSKEVKRSTVSTSGQITVDSAFPVVVAIGILAIKSLVLALSP